MLTKESMHTREIENHRDVITLRDGVRVLLRPMIKEDDQSAPHD